eukprot:scaffold1684_cov214-Amphora_coffeaeformis.AAC.1
MIYSPRAFSLLAKSSLNVRIEDCSFRSHFGCSPDVCSILWQKIDERMQPRPRGMMPKHLLWALLFLKTYQKEDVLAGRAGTTQKTLRKWVWIIIDGIQKLKQSIICWENRKKYGGLHNRWCMVTVDGTDFEILEPRPFSPGWYSHKFKGPGVRYEVALSINGGDIVHTNGPFMCGHNPDITIFRKKLIHKLEVGEMVEADKGYRGEPTKVRIPVDHINPGQKKQKNRARARHETVNHHFKDFGVLRQIFRHPVTTYNMSKHKAVFNAVVVIVQLQINNGEKLFQVDFH